MYAGFNNQPEEVSQIPLEMKQAVLGKQSGACVCPLSFYGQGVDDEGI
jgi:hypothetical protein